MRVVQKTALVVEHDYESSHILGQALATADINCIFAESAPGMWQELASNPDVLILDASLPNMDGLNVLRQVRKESDIPILIRSTRANEDERITGIEIGADDFLPKPCNPRELVARIKSLLRRTLVRKASPRPISPQIRFGDWTLNRTLRELSNARGQRIALGGPSYVLLTEFLQHPFELLTRERLSPLLNRKYDREDRIIDIYISQIRRILGKQANGSSYIETQRAKDYVFTTPVFSTSDY